VVLSPYMTIETAPPSGQLAPRAKIMVGVSSVTGRPARCLRFVRHHWAVLVTGLAVLTLVTQVCVIPRLMVALLAGPSPELAWGPTLWPGALPIPLGWLAALLGYLASAARCGGLGLAIGSPS
jgi:hypothetical protein